MEPTGETRAADESIDCVVISVSDTRTLENDASGQYMVELISDAGHGVVEHTVVPRDPGRLALVLRHWLKSEVNVVFVNGGTGVSAREDGIAVVRRFLDIELPAFAQIFAMLAFEEVGAPALLARVIAGGARGKAVFVLPGARWAVGLGVERLILPELPHIVAELGQEGP